MPGSVSRGCRERRVNGTSIYRQHARFFSFLVAKSTSALPTGYVGIAPFLFRLMAGWLTPTALPICSSVMPSPMSFSIAVCGFIRGLYTTPHTIFVRRVAICNSLAHTRLVASFRGRGGPP